MKHLSVFLCLRYLGSRKIVFLSVAAVALSCGLLIVVASLFTGFINVFENTASDHLGDILIAAPAGFKIADYGSLIERLEGCDIIEAATGVLSGQGLLLVDKGDVRAVRVWGIEANKRSRVSSFGELLVRQKNTSGEINFSRDDVPAEEGGFAGIGLVAKIDELTDEYDFNEVDNSIGRKVILTTGTTVKSGGEDSTAQRFRRKAIKFTITDVVFSGMYEFDQNFVYLPLERLSNELYPGEGAVADMIQIRLRAGADASVARAVVWGVWRDFAKGRFSWAEYVRIETSRQMQAQLVGEYRKQMGILMLIFGVVSGGVVLLVFCIFYLIVMTKRKDIAIIKSCGLGSGSVATVFLVFGLMVGVVGSAVGVVLGYWITTQVNVLERWISIALGIKLWRSSTYMFSRIPSAVNWESVLWICAAAVVAAGIGALIPAVSAARVKPVEILRYE